MNEDVAILNCEVVYIQTREDLDILYEKSTYSIQGIQEEDISNLLEDFSQIIAPATIKTVYLITGEVLNREFELRPDKQYPEDYLTACFVAPDSVKRIRSWKGHWFDDIIDNARADRDWLKNQPWQKKRPTAVESTTTALSDKRELLYCRKSDAFAIGYAQPNGFIVVKGSFVTSKVAESFECASKRYAALRTELEANGTIRNRIFQKDYCFSSPSAAASVVLGWTCSGNVAWGKD